MKKIVSTSDAPAAIGPYSQAVRCGSMLFCAGQIPLDPVTGQMVTGDVSVQAKRVLKNIAALLKAERLSFDRNGPGRLEGGVLVGARPPWLPVWDQTAPDLSPVHEWTAVVDRDRRQTDPLRHRGVLARAGQIQNGLGAALRASRGRDDQLPATSCRARAAVRARSWRTS